jgi:predicted nucleic acid-binding protein
VILVDASVAAKWLLPENGSEAALALVAGPDLLFAPSVIRLEVLGAITRRARKGQATKSESLDRCSKWLGYLDAGTISLVPEGAILNEAVELALGIKHPLHDCLYLAAARQLGAKLVTADRPFWERAKTNYADVELLAGCEAN